MCTQNLAQNKSYFEPEEGGWWAFACSEDKRLVSSNKAIVSFLQLHLGHQ